MKLVAASVFLFVLAGFISWLIGPPLLQDMRLNATQLQSAGEYRITKTECKTRMFLFNTCGVDLTHAETGKDVSLQYMIAGPMIPETVEVLQPADKSAVTTSMGIETRTNRIVTFFGILIFLIGCGFLPILQIVRHGFSGMPQAGQPGAS